MRRYITEITEGPLETGMASPGENDLSSPGDNDSVSVSAALLQCGVCLQVLCQPVTLVCGHTFCRGCLFRAFSRNAKKCPSCRSLVVIHAEAASENVLLRELAMAVNPEQYRLRSHETTKELSGVGLELPVFIYSELLFPGASLNLHLFETRYKILAKRAVESNRKFAYHCPPYGPNELLGIGAVVIICHVVEARFLPDGRCMLEARLVSRAAVTEHWVEEGTGELSNVRVAPLSDKTMSAEEEKAATGAARTAADRWNALSEGERQVMLQIAGPPPQPRDLSQYSLWVAAVAASSDSGFWPSISLEEQRLLLEGTDTLLRLEKSMPFFATQVGGRGRGGLSHLNRAYREGKWVQGLCTLVGMGIFMASICGSQTLSLSMRVGVGIVGSMVCLMIYYGTMRR